MTDNTGFVVAAYVVTAAVVTLYTWRLTRRLKQAGFVVEEINTHTHGKRGARHVIWIATNRR